MKKSNLSTPRLSGTDYFSLDGYKTINERVCFLNLDLILPNIELRISPVTSEDRKINIHIIPNLAVLSVDDVEKFLYKFEFKQKGESHTCKKIDLIKLGKTISTDPEISDEKLNSLIEKIVPVVKENDKLYQIEIPNLRNIAYTWEPKIIKECEIDLNESILSFY